MRLAFSPQLQVFSKPIPNKSVGIARHNRGIIMNNQSKDYCGGLQPRYMVDERVLASFNTLKIGGNAFS